MCSGPGGGRAGERRGSSGKRCEGRRAWGGASTGQKVWGHRTTGIACRKGNGPEHPRKALQALEHVMEDVGGGSPEAGARGRVF